MKKMISIPLLIINCLLPSFSANTQNHAPNIGFVVHPHEGYVGEIDKYNVTAEISNIFLWRVKDQNSLEVNFKPASKWLENLSKSKRVAYPIIDTSIFHTQGWRAEKARKVGQFLTGADGNEWEFTNPDGTKMIWASLYSSIFRKQVFDYTDQLVDWTKKNDPNHKIRGYINGAEWFMPGTVDYNPSGISEFRNWLKTKYDTLEILNNQWGSNFDKWCKVDPPRGILLGDSYVGMRTVGFGCNLIECCYESPLFDVLAKQEYLIEAGLHKKNVPRGLCGIKLDCYDKNGKPIKYYGDGQFYWIDIPDDKDGKISQFCKIPPNAVKARLKLKLMAPGIVHFRNPQITHWPMQHNILPANCLDPNVADRTWKFSSLNNNGQGNIKTNNGNVEFVLNINPIPLPYKHTSLAWDDWITFSYESMAEWLNTCAAYIKQKDPSREVVCYNGCVFGTHTLGDFTTYWQRLDISLAKSPELDVYGVQVCIADRDYTMVTCPIDIARKYGKPIYLTDIVDFPYGLFSGFDPIYRGTLTAIQHGANGVFAYCWLDSAGGADYQFYKHLSSFELKKYVDDLCSAVKKVADYSVYTDIAFILPVMPYSLADNGGYKSDWLDIGGWCQLLNDMGIIADFYTPYELAEVTWDLSKYKMIIVPDCPVLPRKVNSNLVDYVKHGGTIALSATPPYKDLRNMPLKNAFIESIDQKTFVADKFVTNLANEKTPCEDIIQIINKPIEKSIEKGKVIWLREKLGKAYWGQARRNRIYGNTPPTYIKPHYTITAQILRENIRKSLNNLFSKYIRDRLVNFNNSSGSISIVPFLSSVDNYDDAILFVINNGNGRQPSTELKMSKEFTNAIGQVWIDFDRHSKITVNTDGSVIIPDFAHVSIINFRKDF